MNSPKMFEDLETWQAARGLVLNVYELCRRAPLSGEYGFRDQFCRAAVSVMNNLAEGWESAHRAERLQFYNIARRSCGETRSMAYLLTDLKYASSQEQESLQDECRRTGKLISGLIRSISSKG